MAPSRRAALDGRSPLAPLLLLALLLFAPAANAASCRAASSSSPSTTTTGARRRSLASTTTTSTTTATHHRRRRALKQGNDDNRRRALIAQKSASANDAGYSLLGVAPIAVTHTHLLPGTRDQSLAINYFDGEQSFPADDATTPNSGPVDRDGKTIARLLDRSSFKFEVVPVATNAVCGAWASHPDGKIGMFAGHTPMGVQPAGFDNLFLYDPFDGLSGGIQDRGRDGTGLSRNRWYPGVASLPSGQVLVYGGSGDVDFNDRAPDGDIWTPSTNNVARTQAMPNVFADVAFGPYYPMIVALPRPTGAVLMALNSRAGVVVPETGELLAQAPAFPEPYTALVFEYPMSGSLVMLRSDPRLASFGAEGGAREARVTIVITGGVRDAAWYLQYKQCNEEKRYLRECSDAILSIGLTMTIPEEGGEGGDNDNNNNNVAFAFDPEWRVAQMPPRCVHDAVLLPNNKVLIINGVAKGYAGLGDCQLAHDPHNEPWIYDAETNTAVATGHTTVVPRLYHGSAALTARGDVLVTGTTNTKGWENSRDLPLEASAWASEYRVEIYTPSAIGGNNKKRPVILRSPTMAFFAAGGGGGNGNNEGGGFLIETDAPISAVVLSQPGGATHGMALNQRAQDLEFVEEEAAGGRVGSRLYRVAPPSSPANAPGGFYLLFVVGTDGDTYSEGAWLLLRESRDVALPTLPPNAVKVRAASTGFEEEEGNEQGAAASFQCGEPCVLGNGAESAGTGNQGARLAKGQEEGSPWSSVLLASADLDAGALADQVAGGDAEGSYLYVSFWARDVSGGGELTVALADVAAVADGATQTDQAVVPGTRTVVKLTGDGEWRMYAPPPVFLPKGAGAVRLVIGGSSADVDDVETWASGSSTVVNAAFRRAQAQGAMAGHVMPGGAQRNAQFLSHKARAFGVFA
jgi:hypothetical protein